MTASAELAYAAENSADNFQEHAEQAQKLQKWLDANPKYASELQQITQSSNPSEQLQQWFQNHPECATEIQNFLQITPRK